VLLLTSGKYKQIGRQGWGTAVSDDGEHVPSKELSDGHRVEALKLRYNYLATQLLALPGYDFVGAAQGADNA